jgi:hypothetical protein
VKHGLRVDLNQETPVDVNRRIVMHRNIKEHWYRWQLHARRVIHLDKGLGREITVVLGGENHCSPDESLLPGTASPLATHCDSGQNHESQYWYASIRTMH